MCRTALNIDPSLISRIIRRQAGKHARGTLVGDATGISRNTYKDWEDAKRGIIPRKEFAKLHVLAHSKGRIVSCMVTDGTRHD